MGVASAQLPLNKRGNCMQGSPMSPCCMEGSKSSIDTKNVNSQ